MFEATAERGRERAHCQAGGDRAHYQALDYFSPSTPSRKV